MAHKLTIMVPDDTKDVMVATRDKYELTFTDQIRRGVKLLRYILEAQKAGKEFRVYEKDGSHRVIEIHLT